MALSVADRACNLECAKGPVHEFIGPVKIIFVEPPKGAYKFKAWGSAFVALANMFIGATTLSVLLCTLLFKAKFPTNYHIFACTVGYQLCIPSGILMLSSLNGAAVHLNYKDRVYQHLILNLFGAGCGFAGTFVAIILGKVDIPQFTIHAFAGVGAGLFTCVCIITGPCLLLLKKEMFLKGALRSFHSLCGITAFLLSSACFILGLIRPFFQTTSQVPELRNILIGFVFIYTCVIFFESLAYLCKSRE